MMALPTYLLFELSLLISSIAIRNKKPTEIEVVEDIPDSEDEEDFFQPSEEPADSDDYSKYYRSPAKKRKLRYMSRR